MPLPTPGRFQYSPIDQRPDFTWPEGKRLAVHLSVNLEHFAYGEGLGLSYSPGLPHPNTYNWGWREYGNRVGIWRILDLAEQLGVPISALANSELYAHAPEIMDALRLRGDEVVGHGRTNSEHQNDFTEQDEAQLIAEVTATVTQHEGAQPQGWLSPGVNPSAVTTDLLEEAGYSYLLDWPIDDQPVWLTTRSGGRILAVPYPHEINDVPFIALHHGTASEFADAIIDNFDEMLEQSAGQSLVYGISIHAFLIGQPFRMRHFRRALEHINSRRDDIWWATTGQIASHFANVTAQ
jgi:peptidoglycan/xylan/chitin deacetylase (PgdA/CDA1 family)